MSDSPTLHPIRLAALVAFSIALSAGAWAQALFDGTTINHPHPNFYLTGSAEKAVVGQLTDDATRDVAILQDGEIVLMYAPARWHSFGKTPGTNAGTYLDIAILPGDVEAGERDTLLALCPEGLVRLRWEASALLLEEDALLAAEDFRNAKGLLRVVPEVGGYDHVAAVTIEGDVVHAAFLAGDLVDLETVDTSVPGASAFALLDFDGNGGPEYALDNGTSRLRIFSSGGSLIWQSLLNASPAPHLLRLPEGDLPDALVWVTSLPSIDQAMSVLRWDVEEPDDVRMENFLELASPVGQLVLADYYGDGYPDLIGASRVDGVMRVLWNQHGLGSQPEYTFFFHEDIEQTFWFNASQVYGGNYSNPPALAAGDLDGDGDDDPVLASHAGGTANRVQVFLSDGSNEAEQTPDLNPCFVYDEPNATTATFDFSIASPECGSDIYLKGEVWLTGESIPLTFWDSFMEAAPCGEPIFAHAEGTVSECEETCLETYHVQVWAVRMVGGVNGQEVWAGPATTWHFSREALQPYVRSGESLMESEDPCPGGTTGSNQPPVIPP